MKCGRRIGVTLVETIIVMAVIGLLLSLMMPAIQLLRASADKLACQTNLRQIGIAMHHSQATHEQLFPTPRHFPPGGPDPESALSWMALLLPLIGQETLYETSVRECSRSADPFKYPPHAGLATVVPLYCCRMDNRLRAPLFDTFGVLAAYTSYVGITGVKLAGNNAESVGVFGLSPPSLSLIRDGTSNTVLIGERPPPDPPMAGWWYPVHYAVGCHGPNNVISLGSKGPMNCDGCIVTSRLGPGRLENPCDRYHLWSLHPRGANLLFADGSVRFFRYSADTIMPDLITVDGAEPVALPD